MGDFRFDVSGFLLHPFGGMAHFFCVFCNTIIPLGLCLVAY
jgi:hypothetical protein